MAAVDPAQLEHVVATEMELAVRHTDAAEAADPVEDPPRLLVH